MNKIDGKYPIVRETSTIMFRGEEYSFIYSYYKDDDGTFTTTEIDEVNMAQVYNQYRERYGIPFVDEIAKIKKMYGLSSTKMAMILGFGENQINNYLDGEIPDKAHGKILSAIRNPAVFSEYVRNARGQIGEKSYEKIMAKIKEASEYVQDPMTSVIFPIKDRSIYNGYAEQNLEKTKDVIMCALSILGNTFKSKMNKILFYVDMVSYRNRGMAITGLAYKAEKYGTIPFRNDKLYSLLEIPQQIIYDGERELTPFYFDESYFIKNLSESERKVVEYVCQIFRDCSSSEISRINHQEEVWEKYKFSGKPIPFGEAFHITKA